MSADVVCLEEFALLLHHVDALCVVIDVEPVADIFTVAVYREVLPLKEAVDRAVMCMDAVIVLGSTFAIVFGEVMKGRDKFLLVE